VSEEATFQAPERHVEERLPRAISRLLDRSQHREGYHVANFLGEVEDMVSDGRFYGLNDRDIRTLTHVLATGIKPALNVEGAEVLMTPRQWGAFVGIRRTYLHERRNPANLIAALKTRFRVTSSADHFSENT
jgi:hypothetical protein